MVEIRKPPRLPPMASHGIFGTCLPLFAISWGKITSDRWLLPIIHHGYSIEFLFSPASALLGDPSHQHILQQEADALLSREPLSRFPLPIQDEAPTPNPYAVPFSTFIC